MGMWTPTEPRTWFDHAPLVMTTRRHRYGPRVVTTWTTTRQRLTITILSSLHYLFRLRPSYLRLLFIHSFIHSFIPAISIAPLQVHYYSEALQTIARILYRSFMPKRTGNCR